MALDLSDLDTFDFNDRPQAAKNKPKTGLDLFDDLDEFEPRKPYSRRGSVEARNKQAEPDILSKRAQRFQLGAQLDAELSPVMGRGEDLIAHQQRVEEAAAMVRPDLPAGWNRQEFESFMDAERGGMGVTPGTGRTAEDAMVVGQNPGVVGAKFREGWRTTKAGAAADEYLRTGRITVGTTPGVGDVDYPVYLEGPAAEKYVRELASVTEDTALAEAFDKQVGAGARALTSTLSQPEQLLSIPGGIVGAMVGQPTLGAALGAAPSTVKGYYSDLLANLQAGASHDIASANALAGAGIDFATETLGGRFGASGGMLGAGARSAAEEASAELGRMGSDYAFSLADESFASKLPKTFGEGAERVGEAGIAGGLGAAIMVGAPRLPGKLGEGLAAAREMLAKAGGVSDGRPDVARPEANTAPSIDAPISIAPTSIDTVDTQITTGINTEEAKREGVNPAGVSKEREIPAKEDTLSRAPLSPVQLTTADAGTIIDTRLSSLREASQRNRLDDGTVKTLQREDEELRLTLQEDESRKQQGILQTPERPYLSDNARNLISQKRAEIREKLEQHRAAVGYGNELRDLETRLNKLGESDTEFVALADSLVRGQGAGVTRAAQQMAATTPQNQPQALPATPVAPPVSEAPVAPQEAATSVPASAPVVAPAPAGQAAREVQTPVTSTQVPQVSNTKPERTKTSTPKPISDKDALAQAFTELQTRSLNDPEFQKQVTANPSLMRQMATQRASEIVAQSSAPKAPEATATDAADVPTAAAPSSRLASVQNARAAMLVVGNAEVPASSEMRRVANELKTSPNVQDTKVVVVSAEDAATPGNPLHKQMEDGTNASKPGVYNANDDTIYIRDDVPAEVAVHETTHAATVKAIAAVEQGVVSDPDATLALDNLKAATTRLGELTEADLPGVSPDILARIKYAGKNVQETVAILRSSPETAQALRDANITVDIKVDRKTKQPVKMNWFKAVVNNIADLLFRTKVFKQQHRDAVVRVVEKMLLADVAIDSSKKLERTDVRAIKMADVAAGNAAARQVGTGANKPVPKTDDAPTIPPTPNNIQPDKVTELPEGTTEERTIERLRGWSTRLLAPKGLGSTNAKQMGERSVGTANAMRLEGDVLSAKLSQQMTQHIAKILGDQPARIQALYRYKIGEYLAGNTAVASDIPTDIRETVEAMREILDNNTMRMIALGAINADDIPKMLNNLGRWIHRDFEVFHHEPGEFKRITQERAKAGNDPLAPLLDQVMEEMTLPEPGVIAKIGEMAGKKSGKGMKDWKADATKTLRELKGQPEPKKPKNKRLAVIRDEAEKYLRDMAAKWGIGRNTPLEGPDGVIARLSTLSANGTEDLQKAAARWANSLLDPTSMPIDDAPYVPSVLAIDDSSIDKKRAQVPPWLQELWGKFKDPNAMFLTSLDNQANIIAKFTALQEYKQRGMANGTVLENKAGMTDANMHPKGFMLLGSKDDQIHYGPLQNMWIKREDYDYLGITASQRAAEKVIQDSFFKGYLGLLSLVGQPAKMMLIALNHTSLALQTLSSLFLHSRSSPKRLAAGLKAARYTTLGGTRFGKDISDEQLKKDVNSMVSQGLLVNNALAGDARRKLREFIISPGEQFLSVPQRAMKKIGRGYGKLLDSAGRLMSIGDEAAKVMMVYARMEDLQSIHPDKSRQELLELATEHAMQTMPVQMREAPLARMASNSGVIDVFATWYAAMARNTYNHLKIADEYSKMPSKEAKKYAFTEMSLLAVKAYGAYYLAKSFQLVGSGLTYAFAAGDDEEEIKAQAEAGAKAQKEKYEGIRGIAPEHTVGDFAVLREAAPDVYRVASFQRYDPMPIGALMSAAERGDEEEKANILNSFLFSEAPLVKALTTAIGYFPEAAASGVQDVYGNVDARALDARQAFLNGMQEVIAGVAVPGSVTSIQRQLDDPVDATPLETFLTNMGATVSTVDVRRRTGEIGADYLATLNRIKSGASREASSKDTMFSDASVDFKGDLLAKAEAWRFARKKVQYVQSLGKSDLWIKDAIKSNPYASSLSKEEINSLLTGRFVVPNYNKWLKEQRETDLKDPKNSMRKEEVRAQYARYEQDLSKFYEGLQELLQKEGITKR